MMAFSNKDVQELNGMARDLKRGAGELGKEEYIYTIERNAGEELGRPQTVREERRFSVGDQIVFTKIDKGLGVNNGTLGRVTELSQSNIKVAIEKDGVSQEISFSPNLYKRFDNGWAVTIHKNQRATVDLAFVLASFEQYKNLAYVALTRHAKSVQVYASRFEFWRDEKLPERLGHAQDKLSSLDYVSSDRALELLQSDEKMLGSSLKKVGQRLEAVGYVGQRAWSTVCDKVLGRPVESNLVRIDRDIENLKSEADRAAEKFNPTPERGVGDHGQALGPQQGLYKPEGNSKVKGVEVKRTKTTNATTSQPRHETIISGKEGANRNVDDKPSQPPMEEMVEKVEVGGKKPSSNENSQPLQETIISGEEGANRNVDDPSGLFLKKGEGVTPLSYSKTKAVVSSSHDSQKPVVAVERSVVDKPSSDLVAEKTITKKNIEREKTLTKTEKFALADRALKSCDTVSLSKDVLRKYGYSEGKSNSKSVAFRDGKLIYNLSGQYEGSVHCYKTGKTTPLFQKLREEKGLDFKGALSYILPYCRGSVVQDVEGYLKGKKIRQSSAEEIKAHKAAEEALNKKREQDHNKEISQKASGVKSCIEKSVPIKGTPAETYLRNERGIKGEISDSLRYLPPKSSFTYGNKKPFVKTGAMVSIAKTLDGDTKAVQLTYLTSDGKRCVDENGKKFIKATYGSPTGAFVELQKGDSKSPIVLAEGVETALSIKETGLKGSYYCSLGIANIDKLDVKNRDIIIAGDWDGSTDKPSWLSTEKAKASLEKKGNRVKIILPVETKENSNKKLDFNDLLTSGGVKSLQSLLQGQVPGLITSSLLPRENQSEHNHEKINDISSNKTTTDLPKSGNPTEHVKTQEKPLEQSAEISDGEKLKQELFKKQADLIMNHRQIRGMSIELFKRQFQENPEMAIDAQSSLVSEPRLPLKLMAQNASHHDTLSQEKARSLEKEDTKTPDGEKLKQDLFKKQADLIMNHRQIRGMSIELFKRQFQENPEMAIDAQSSLVSELRLPLKLMAQNASMQGEGGSIRRLSNERPALSGTDDAEGGCHSAAQAISMERDRSQSTQEKKTPEKNQHQEQQVDRGPSL